MTKQLWTEIKDTASGYILGPKVTEGGIQVDGIWSYVGKMQARLTREA